MKMWLDDTRRPPNDSWTWVKSNPEAKKLIEEHLEEITEMSLDHDLGANKLPGFDLLPYEQQIMLRGGSEDDGLALIKWMCSTRHVPHSQCKITIHSWNVVRSKRMQEELSDLGVTSVCQPFTVE